MSIRHIKAILYDQRGGLGFNMIWICFFTIFLVPFLWDMGSVHYARRMASTGADAAALAAAQEYARAVQYVPAWQGKWLGSCELGEFTPQQVVGRYRLLPALSAPSGIGSGMASSYAAQNRDNLTAYEAWPEFAGRVVEGVPIPWIVVRAETLRHVFTAYEPIYGRDFDVPNRARAVAYLWRWNSTPRPCYGWIDVEVPITPVERAANIANCTTDTPPLDERDADRQQRQQREQQCQELETNRLANIVTQWGVVGNTYDFTFEWKVTLHKDRT